MRIHFCGNETVIGMTRSNKTLECFHVMQPTVFDTLREEAAGFRDQTIDSHRSRESGIRPLCFLYWVGDEETVGVQYLYPVLSLYKLSADCVQH